MKTVESDSVLHDRPAPDRAEGRRWRVRHPVAAFLIRRISAGAATLLAATVLIFAAVQILPGNVAEAVLGRSATPAVVALVRKELNLNRPLPVRYGSWLSGMLTGNLGYSTAAAVNGSKVAVSSQIGPPLMHSLILAAVTFALLAPLALLLGALAALRAGRLSDHAISTTALVFGAMPEFLVGTLLIVIFFSQLELLPPISPLSAGQAAGETVRQLVLPVATLLAVSMAFTVRLVRAGTIDVLKQQYVAMGRLNGYKEYRVIWRFALRNALAPSIQALALTAQYLLGGIIVVESVFDYPGIGTQFVSAITERDIQEIMVIATILAAATIMLNILADLIVMFLVPKLRTGAR